MSIHDKKEEYILKLEKVSSNLYLQGIRAIYSFTLENNKIHKNLLKEFQGNLKEISLWTEDDIISEYERFKNVSEFTQLDKLISSILNMFGSKAKPWEYMFQCYLSIARKIWKEPYIFYEKNVSKTDIQKNYIKIEKIIRKCIRETFSQIVPFELQEEEDQDQDQVNQLEKNEDDKNNEADDEDEDDESDDESDEESDDEDEESDDEDEESDDEDEESDDEDEESDDEDDDED
jgi:hypothetical protein